MFLESHVIISLISIIILFLSFIASFKHQNATIFFVGLIVSLLINKCEVVVPSVKKFFAMSDSTSTASTTASTTTASTPMASTTTPSTTSTPNLNTILPLNSQQLKDLIKEKTTPPNPPPKTTTQTSVKAKPMEATNKKKTTTTKQDTKMPEGMTFLKPTVEHMNTDASKPIPPEVAQRLVTNSIKYAANRNQQRAVYSFGRPLINEVAEGKASLLSATPDFLTFGNVLVGNLRLPNEPTPDNHLKKKPEQNPELLKLTKNPYLIPSSDYFPNCKSAGLGNNETIEADPRDKLRCRIPGIY